MRIVGVDRVPSTPFARGDDARKPVLTPIQMRTRKAKRALAARGLVEAVTWSFVAKRAGRTVRRRQAGAGARQSDRGRTLRHAAEPHARPDRGGAEERRSRLCRRGAVRGRADLQGRPAGGSVHRRDRRAPRAGQGAPASAGTGRARPSRSTPSTPRPMRFAVLAAAGAPMQALQVVPGGPAWFHPGRSGTIQIGPQNVLGHFGELHPRALEALERRRAAGRLRGDPGEHPRAEGEGDARQAGARALAVPAGRARFRLRGRPRA